MFTLLWLLSVSTEKSTRSQAIGDVVEELRKQCNLRHDTPFNLKYLDVEGCILSYFYLSLCFFH